MLARGNAAVVHIQTCKPDAGRIHSYLEGQGIKTRENMIPLDGYTKYGRRLITKKEDALFKRNANGLKSLARLNTAPELYKSELPPILAQGQGKGSGNCTERRHRPLTPLVVNSNRKQSTKSLPKNYRINLDLVPLVEVGDSIGNLSLGRRRQTSLSSSGSSFSSSTPSPRLLRRDGSPRPPSEAKDGALEKVSGFQKRTNSTESLEEDSSDNEENDGKDTMILRWLQTVEKSHESAAATLPAMSELLPCIKEGKLA